VKKALFLAALAVAAVVPAASASSSTGVKLALVPLPASALPAAGRHLPITRDSGVVSNAQAASQATGNVTPKRLKRLGRISGYLLDYGSPFAGTAGIREIQTEIDRYRSPADAQKGYVFWRRDEVKKAPLKGMGFHFSVHRVHLAGLPKPNWAYAGTLSIKGLKPIEGVDAEFQHGSYVLDVSVAAGSNAAAARLLPTVAHRLYGRFLHALAGRLKASPVKLPRLPKPGPPPHGPKPAGIALRTADLGGGANVLQKGYSNPKHSFDQNALSVYDLTMTSGGTYSYLSQEVLVGGSKLEVQYFAAIAVNGIAAGAGKGLQVTPVDLSALGDNARGELLKVKIGGRTAYETALVLSRGSYLDFLVSASASPFSTADVGALARLAAKRLNAAFG
jgi:hypothetical protein